MEVEGRGRKKGSKKGGSREGREKKEKN